MSRSPWGTWGARARGPQGPCDGTAWPVFVALEFLDLDDMTDAGMFVWAGIIAVGTLAGSWFVALWWQRRKERQKQEGA